MEYKVIAEVGTIVEPMSGDLQKLIYLANEQLLQNHIPQRRNTVSVYLWDIEKVVGAKGWRSVIVEAIEKADYICASAGTGSWWKLFENVEYFGAEIVLTYRPKVASIIRAVLGGKE